MSKIITLPCQHFAGRLPKRPNPEIRSYTARGPPQFPVVVIVTGGRARPDNRSWTGERRPLLARVCSHQLITCFSQFGRDSMVSISSGTGG